MMDNDWDELGDLEINVAAEDEDEVNEEKEIQLALMGWTTSYMQSGIMTEKSRGNDIDHVDAHSSW